VLQCGPNSGRPVDTLSPIILGMNVLKVPEPVQTLHLYPEERSMLIDLLGSLSDADWARPTGCPGWSVRDIATHLLADELGVLSRQRDEFRPQAPRPGETLGVFLARINDEWVTAMRRLSGPVIVDLLRWTGEQTCQYWSGRDLMALAGAVSWAGPGPAPRWLDVAREYTERWTHQQQIREAVGRPLMSEARWIGPVIATFVWALPHTFRAVEATVGTAVTLTVDGEGGATWTIVRAEAGAEDQEQRSAWRLFAGRPDAPAARVNMSADTAWRLFTLGIPPTIATQRAQLRGDQTLAHHLLTAVAIIA
jgi:uncharacterized protein (TIGR03083 family)